MQLASWIAVLLFAADLAIRIGLSIRVIMRRRPVGVSLAWLAVILIFPFGGALVYLMIGPSTSHSGFHRFKVSDATHIQGGDYFHNLHHRYFEVNYGVLFLPMDKWFGTFHDGSVEAHEQMKERRRR